MKNSRLLWISVLVISLLSACGQVGNGGAVVSPSLPTETAAAPPAATETAVAPPTATEAPNEEPTLSRPIISAENSSHLEKAAFLDLPSSFILTLAFSPDGRTLVTADRNGEVIFWEVGTWVERTRLVTPSELGTMSISPDGETIITASAAGEVKGWDWDGNSLFTFTYGGSVFDTAFSPTGRYVAVGGDNDTIMILDVDAQEKVTDLTSDHQYITNVVFSPDGRLLASYERPENVMKTWDTSTWQETLTFSHVTERIDYHDIVFSPHGEYLAVASTQNAIKVLNVNTWQVVKQFLGHTRGSYWLDFSPDGSLLASACDDMTLKLWEVETGRVLRTFTNQHEVGTVAFSPDGTLLAYGVWGEGVQIWQEVIR